MSSITQLDAEREIKRLVSAGYNPPGESTAEGMSRIWADVFDGVAVEELRTAVSRYIRDGGRFWPRPGELRTMALGTRNNGTPTDLRSRYYAWEQTHEGGCPVCGAVLQLFEGRYAVVHDFHEHRRQGIPHVGRPYPPSEKAS